MEKRVGAFGIVLGERCETIEQSRGGPSLTSMFLREGAQGVLLSRVMDPVPSSYPLLSFQAQMLCILFRWLRNHR